MKIKVMLAKIKQKFANDPIIKLISRHKALLTGEFLFTNTIKKPYHVDTLNIFISSTHFEDFITQILTENPDQIQYSIDFDNEHVDSTYVKFTLILNIQYNDQSNPNSSSSRISRDSSNYNTQFIDNSIINNSLSENSNDSDLFSGGSIRHYAIHVVFENIDLKNAISHSIPISSFKAMYDGKKLYNVNNEFVVINITNSINKLINHESQNAFNYVQDRLSILKTMDMKIQIKSDTVDIQQNNIHDRAIKWIVQHIIKILKIHINQLFKFVNLFRSFKLNELVLNIQIFNARYSDYEINLFHEISVMMKKYKQEIIHNKSLKQEIYTIVDQFSKQIITHKNIIDKIMIENREKTNGNNFTIFDKSKTISKTTKTIDFENMIGYDMIQMKDINSLDFISNNSDGLIILHNKSCNLITIQYIMFLIEDPLHNWFYSCNDNSMLNVNRKNAYIKLALASGNMLIRVEYISNIVDLFQKGFRVFELVTSRKIDYTASHINIFGTPNYVSTNHCQNGSDHTEYTLEYYDYQIKQNSKKLYIKSKINKKEIKSLSNKKSKSYSKSKSIQSI